MRQLFNRLFSCKPANDSYVNRPPVRPGIEALEDRLTPAGSSIFNGNILIQGSSSTYNVVNVYQYSGYYQVSLQMGSYTLVNNFATSEVWGGKVLFYGAEDADYFSNYSFLQAEAYGFGGDDMLQGGHNNDYLDGGWGYDYLWGFGGNDSLFGGWESTGNYMVGGDGDDYMLGSLGSDRMFGGNGHDTIDGYFGDDLLYGENGQDVMYGSYGNDYLDGGLDWDRLYGGADSDSLNGGDDGWADYMSGGAGFDYFQQDWAWKRDTYYGYGYYQYNRDMPVDYEAGEGFYNF